jgi:hypothetical protein
VAQHHEVAIATVIATGELDHAIAGGPDTGAVGRGIVDTLMRAPRARIGWKRELVNPDAMREYSSGERRNALRMFLPSGV